MEKTIKEYSKFPEIYEDEIDLRELLYILKNHKLLIFFTTIIFVILASVYVYIATPIYKSYAIVDIKEGGKDSITNDFLTSGLITGAKDETEKQIEILKTYSMNSEALKKVNYKIQFFIKKNLKTIELYGKEVPIKIYVKIKNPAIIGKKIKIIPKNDKEFIIKTENSSYIDLIINKIKKYLFNAKIISFNEKHKYGEVFINKYFHMEVDRNGVFDKELIFKINGSNRDIYESIIKNNLSVTQVNKKASLINVAYEDNIPKRANEYVDALVEGFLKKNIEEKSKHYNNIINFISNQLEKIKEKLKVSENKLERYRVSKNVIKPSIQAQNLIQELTNIDIQISQNELKRKLIDNILYYIKNNKDITSIAPSLIELNDEPTIELIKNLQQAQLKEQEYAREYTDKFPDLIKLRTQIKSLKRNIIKNINNLKTTLRKKKYELNKIKYKYEKILKSLPKKEKIIINMQRDYEVNSKMYSYLLEKKAEKEILKASIVSDFKIVDRAYTLSEPVRPKKKLIVVVGLIIGLIIGVLLAFLKAFLDNKIKNRDDIERLTSIPIYGVIPFIKRKEVKVEVLEEPDSYFAEAFRKLRVNLQFNLKKNKSNVILVTSTIPGEGKTTISANLAGIFSLTKAKCIILNMDLRKPALHRLFNIDNKIGMSNLLSEDKDINEVIHRTVYPNIDVIPAGPTPPNPSELMLADTFPNILEELKRKYKYIFIDTPPIGLVTDTLSLMQYVDFVLMVVRENYARKDFIKDFEKFAIQYEVKRKGIVLNAAKETGGGYGYGYGYKYGY